MTLDEYKKLAEEYKTTDSISKKRELKSKILNALVSLAKHLEHLYNKYGSSFINDSEWIEDKGGYELSEVGDEGNAYIRYVDHWGYGGECDVGIVIPLKYFDANERRKLEEELKIKHIDILKKAIINIDKEINKLENDKISLLDKLKELED